MTSYTTNSFEFNRNADVLMDGNYIGRFESDGRLALADDYRDQEVANAVFAALREQIHVGGDYEPPFGWPLEMYAGLDLRETNI